MFASGSACRLTDSLYKWSEHANNAVLNYGSDLKKITLKQITIT